MFLIIWAKSPGKLTRESLQWFKQSGFKVVGLVKSLNDTHR